MPIHLTASAGPLLGRRLTFDTHDIFLLERSKTINPAIGDKEKFVSRVQFLIEFSPPRCRLVDLGNPSGTFVNGKRVAQVELHHNDEIKAGHTFLRVEIPGTSTEFSQFMGEPSPSSVIRRAKARDGLPIIHGYQLERELGRGPFGSVYLAVREEDDTEFAIKTIVPALPPSRDDAVAYLNDAACLLDLEHPHIVGVHYMGLAQGLLWFANELVNGPDLGSLVRERGPIEPRIAVRMMIQALSALEYAHENEIGHSDLKPSNVFLEEQPDNKRIVKVSDFGLIQAYAASPLSGLMLTDRIGAVSEWIAPEQISSFSDVTATADQFRAAATLYYVLTGKSLYNFTSTSHLLACVLDGAVVPLRSRRRELDPDLATVVECALSREPVDRYPDVATFAEALMPFAA